MPRFLRPGLLVTVFLAGCTGLPTQMPDRPERLPRGYTYYLDGAGGGSAVRHWSQGIKDGLLAAGYRGAGELFSWETGLGVIADQDASVKYKRSKAAALAGLMLEYQKTYPSAPINVIGFSAGPAVAVFALEALPEEIMVDDVILLGASIGANYDLARALRRVRGHIYLFTSSRDAVIGVLVGATGTADRKQGEAAAGVEGFALPPDASAETRRLYAEKVVTIPWTKEFERAKNYGGHFDNVKMEFIRDHVAPLMRFVESSESTGTTVEGGRN